MKAKQTQLEAEPSPAGQEYVAIMPRWVVGVVLAVTMGPLWLFLWWGTSSYAAGTESFVSWTHIFGWFVVLLATTLFLGWYLSKSKIAFTADRIRFPRGVELRWEEVEGSRIVRFAGLKFIR